MNTPESGTASATMLTEYTWRHDAFIAVQDTTVDRASAEEKAKSCLVANPGADVAVVSRKITPWRDAEHESEEE